MTRLSIIATLTLSVFVLSTSPMRSNPRVTVASESPTARNAQQSTYSQPVQNRTTPLTSLNNSGAPNVNQGQADSDNTANREARYTSLLVLVGILAIVVAVLQYCAAKSASNAATKSAEAASDSAQTASLALHSDRPLVIVKEITMNFDERGHSLTAHVTFCNYGRSPAIILDCFLGLQTVAGDAIRSLSKDSFNSNAFERHSIQTQVLGVDATLKEVITTKFLHPRVFEEVLDRATGQIAHGRILYRGTFQLAEPYESSFCWFYVPPSLPEDLNGFFAIGPKELNVTI